MAKTNKSRYAILGILANAPKSSGYDIRSLMKESTDYFWKETFSSIYPVLDTLENEKLITRTESSTSGRNKKTYKITKEGLRTLQNWLNEDVELEQLRNELLLKIFFGQLNSVDANLNHVEKFQQQITAKKAILQHAKKNMVKEYADDPNLPFWQITVEFGLRRIDAGIEWAEFARKQLLKLKNR